MAEQLILKGTLEGHVRPPEHHHRPLIDGLLTRDTEWLGHQPGYLAGEVCPRPSASCLDDRLLTLLLLSPNMLLSASRDKTLIIWNLTRDETQYGYPKRSLHGHSHIVSDCVR